MDERREERLELEADERAEADERREQAEAKRFWDMPVVNYGSDPQDTWNAGVRAAARRQNVSAKREKFDRKRGRHKKRASAEVRAWNEQHIPPSPPPWMDRSTADGLLALRRTLDPFSA